MRTLPRTRGWVRHPGRVRFDDQITPARAGIDRPAGLPSRTNLDALARAGIAHEAAHVTHTPGSFALACAGMVPAAEVTEQPTIAHSRTCGDRSSSSVSWMTIVVVQSPPARGSIVARVQFRRCGVTSSRAAARGSIDHGFPGRVYQATSLAFTGGWILPVGHFPVPGTGMPRARGDRSTPYHRFMRYFDPSRLGGDRSP